MRNCRRSACAFMGACPRRLHRGRGSRRAQRAGRAVVRREPVQSRCAARGGRRRARDQAHQDRHRRFQSLQPTSDADRHGDRRARRACRRSRRVGSSARASATAWSGWGSPTTSRLPRCATPSPSCAACCAGEAVTYRRPGVLGQQREARIFRPAAGHADLHGGDRRPVAAPVRAGRRRPDDLQHVPARLYRARARVAGRRRGESADGPVPQTVIQYVPCVARRDRSEARQTREDHGRGNAVRLLGHGREVARHPSRRCCADSGISER